MPALLEKRSLVGWPVIQRPLQSDDSAAPQSVDGRELAARIDQAQAQLAEPAEAWGELADEIDDFDYRPMPPKRFFTMRVRMRRPERGRPMPFVFDDDDID
ncbi:MAG TPA: hypothetical protein VKV26_23980 [Dehalococcoidia bacterium]|nr:hypothetical protein [Dehalococcoidia bacterium]